MYRSKLLLTRTNSSQPKNHSDDTTREISVDADANRISLSKYSASDEFKVSSDWLDIAPEKFNQAELDNFGMKLSKEDSLSLSWPHMWRSFAA